jgi:NAD-dependent SIR2 family protein deacetylase
MSVTHPQLAKELVGTDPSTVVAGTNKKLKWRCGKCNWEWEARGSNRSVKSTGCPVCAFRIVVPGKNDMATTHQHLVSELIGINPSSVVAGTGKKLQWKCKECSHKWKATGYNRSQGRGCPACYGRVPILGVTDMATTHPILARELVGTDPRKLIAGTGKKLLWRCGKCKHKWVATGATRVSGCGCPCCSNQVLVPGKNDLATTRPDLASEYLGDPAMVLAGTEKNLNWRCNKCACEWKATGANRVKKNGTGCPSCANRKVLPGFNDMQTLRPDLAKEYIGDATKVIPGTGSLLRWKCSKCSYKWSSTGSDRSGGHGCKKCAKYGFQVANQSVFYLISDGPKLKFGIAGTNSTRLYTHGLKGWKVLETIPLDGESAWAFERSVKKAFRKKGIPLGKFPEKFDGFTESWYRSDMSVRSIKGLCRKLGVPLAV